MTDFTKIPFNDIIKFGQATMLDCDLFTVSWILGRFCNYSCSYCWPYAHSDTLDYQSVETYCKTIDEIKRQANENNFNNFHWSFSGGEPTAYKHLFTLLKKIKNDSIHMTTNLSPGLNYWNRFIELLRNARRCSLTASFHHEFADESEFVNKILHLMDNKIFVTVNQVMVPNMFYELYERCKRFASHGINVTLKPQSDSTASYVLQDYTNDMIDIMKTGFPQKINESELLQVKLFDSKNNMYYIDQAERFNAYGFNSFTNWNCNSGYQSIVIRTNEVKRSYSCKDEILGTLENFTLFKSSKKCITNKCVSSADSKIPKCK